MPRRTRRQTRSRLAGDIDSGRVVGGSHEDFRGGAHRPASMIGFPSAKAPAGMVGAYQRNDRSRAAAALGSANHSGAWQRCPYPVR